MMFGCPYQKLVCSGILAIKVEHSITGPTAPAHNGDVEVIIKRGEQPTNLQEVAIIQVYATGDKAELPRAIEALKDRASQLGCNTVAKVSVDRGSAMSVTGTCGSVPAALVRI